MADVSWPPKGQGFLSCTQNLAVLQYGMVTQRPVELVDACKVS